MLTVPTFGKGVLVSLDPLLRKRSWPLLACCSLIATRRAERRRLEHKSRTAFGILYATRGFGAVRPHRAFIPSRVITVLVTAKAQDGLHRLLQIQST